MFRVLIILVVGGYQLDEIELFHVVRSRNNVKSGFLNTEISNRIYVSFPVGCFPNLYRAFFYLIHGPQQKLVFEWASKEILDSVFIQWDALFLKNFLSSFHCLTVIPCSPSLKSENECKWPFFNYPFLITCNVPSVPNSLCKTPLVSTTCCSVTRTRDAFTNM